MSRGTWALPADYLTAPPPKFLGTKAQYGVKIQIGVLTLIKSNKIGETQAIAKSIISK